VVSQRLALQNMVWEITPMEVSSYVAVQLMEDTYEVFPPITPYFKTWLTSLVLSQVICIAADPPRSVHQWVGWW
jgi:hypothetical protein